MLREECDENWPKKRRAYRCSDRMCGAEDCATCYPFAHLEQSLEDETEDETENKDEDEDEDETKNETTTTP